jgi:hypothetical protein
MQKISSWIVKNMFDPSLHFLFLSKRSLCYSKIFRLYILFDCDENWKENAEAEKRDILRKNLQPSETAGHY